MKHGSLFAGIGCWSYAADKLGWETVFHCENNPFCQSVLKYYWPDAGLLGDITKTDFTPYANRIDVLSGSCPCQPFSTAGKQEGTTDPRHLWPQMLRAIREIKPPWVCYENVPGLLSIENGVVFETVCTDLESEGYEVAPFNIPATGAGAFHYRYRLWIVANRNGIGCGRSGVQREQPGGAETIGSDKNDRCWNAANSNSDGHGNLNGLRQNTAAPGAMQEEQEERQRLRFIIGGSGANESWLEAATRLCGVDDGNAGRLDITAISKPKWRIESLKAYGNAIYWPIAFNIFQAIAASHPQ